MLEILDRVAKAVSAKVPAIKEDKVKHFIISFVFGAIAATVLVPILAFVVAMLPGIYKEYMDSRTPNNYWDWSDAVADALGAGAGVLLVSSIF